MNVTTSLGVAAAVFGVAMGLSPLLQVRHMVGAPLVGRRLAAVPARPARRLRALAPYGVALGNTALIVSNAVAITSYAITTATVMRLRATSGK